MTHNDDFLLDESQPLAVQTTQDDFWADDKGAPPPEVANRTESPSPETDAREEPLPPEGVQGDELALKQLAVLDVPEQSSSTPKHILPVREPPPGDPDDLAGHEDIFEQKLPVRVIRHPRGGRRIIVGTGGGVESYISGIWAEKFPSAVPAHRIPPGRRIVMAPYRVGVRIKFVLFGKGIAYLVVIDDGLRLVKRAVYDGK